MTLTLAFSLSLGACTAARRIAPKTLPPSGTIEMNTLADVAGKGGGGSGTLYFRGATYRLSIGGLGVRGDQLALLQATGQVSEVDDVSRIAGRYAQALAKISAGGDSSREVWLQNQNGVLLHLTVPRGSRMPPLYGDAIEIRLE
jgi:hypothetical protein